MSRQMVGVSTCARRPKRQNVPLDALRLVRYKGIIFMRDPNQPLPSKFLHTLTWLLAFCAVSLLTACSSTHIRGSKTSAASSVSPFRNVMVAALDDRPDVGAQFESDVVYFLQQRKVVGVGSSGRFALSDFQEVGEEIRKKCANTGAESLLLVRTTDRTTFEKGPGYERYTEATDIETDVQLTATLYRLSDGALIWNGVVDTILKDQYDTRVVMKKVANVIVNNLAKEKVIP